MRERLHNGNPWSQVWYGGKFHYLKPRPEEIRINDIAHALGMNCRFNGHVKSFYSVAQHSCLVADKVYDDSQNETWAMAALLHDAAEAYIPDMPRPIKGYLDGFHEIEDRILRVILEKYDLPDITDVERNQDLVDSIKTHDNRSVITEKRDLLKPGGPKWEIQDQWSPYDEKIITWTPMQAKREFLERFRHWEEVGLHRRLYQT